MKKVLFAALIIVCAFTFVSWINGIPTADARSAYLTSCMTAASNATGCHPSAVGIAGKAPTLTSTDCKSCHHHGLSGSPVVTTDKTSYTSTENILFKFTGGSQSGRAGLVVYNLAGTSEVARGVIAEDNSATLSVPASVFGAIANTAIKTAWRGNAINTTNGTSNVCTTQVPCTAHEFSAIINTPAITITAGGTTGTLTGTVTNASGGAAIAGATVTANGVSATTNASGVYTMTVAAGTYTATASATGFTGSSASVTVTAGGTTTRNFALTAAATTGTLTGMVTNASGGAAIAGATVTANGVSATTNASGVYTMTVNAGTYTATVSATGFTGSSASVTITAGGTTTRNFALTATTTCTRVAPTVTFNSTSGTVSPGGTVTYTATVTNKDASGCTNSTFALSVASETGTAANFVLPSTVSASSPNPCSLAPGGTCTATLTVRAQTAAAAGATDAVTIRAADSTNHGALPGSGAATTTIAAAAANYTLTVASSNPNSGVAITVSPNDRNGRGNGTTQFTRSYSSTTNINLTAPATTGSYTFQKWQRDGSDYATTRAITISLDRNRTMTAVYVSSSTNYTMTIASSSPTSGVAITVSPNDRNGRGSGTTQFTRSYRIGTAVTLTAPSTASGNSFQKWQMGTTDVSTNRAVTVTVNSSFTMRAVYGTSTSGNGNYVILASNDLGMHCACPGVGNFLLLPPFNTIRAQAFQKGGDPVALGDTTRYRMTYSILENTDAILKADPYFADYIKWSPLLFPGYLPVRADGRVQSISGATLSGDMTVKAGPGAWWEVVGTPAFPVVTGTSTDIMLDPLGGPNRTPYLTGRIQLLDKATSAVLATDDITVPVAFGGCCSCHLSVAASYGYTNPTTEQSFQVMGWLHSGKGAQGMIDFAKIDPTNDGRGGPIRCSWCHWDPAMGESAAPGLPNVWPNYSILPGANFTKADIRVSSMTFSEVLHGFHVQNSTVLSSYDPDIAKNCYDCHPGNNVNCYRDTHTTKTINGNAIWCTDCHGDLNQRVAQGQLAQPWQASTLPKCATCHGNNYGEGSGALNTGIFGQFLNSSGHAGNKVLCSSCHGSPHALNPSTLAKDNVQNIKLQNDPRPIGVCNVCHTNRSNTWAVPPHSGSSD